MRYLLSIFLLLIFSCICFAGDPKVYTDGDIEKYKSGNEESTYQYNQKIFQEEREREQQEEQQKKREKERIKASELTRSRPNKKQIRISTFEQAEWGEDRSYGGWIGHGCRKYCQNHSANVDEYLQKGWRVVSSQRISIFENPFTNSLYTGWCRCIGTEYILEREN